MFMREHELSITKLDLPPPLAKHGSVLLTVWAVWEEKSLNPQDNEPQIYFIETLSHFILNSCSFRAKFTTKILLLYISIAKISLRHHIMFYIG